jgi:ribosomal protein S18 acetylase RimI-like enzyme
MIQKATTNSDFHQIAVMHKESLGSIEFFLSKTSLKFITCFYAAVSKYSTTLLLANKNEEGIVMGFLLSTEDRKNLLVRFFKENLYKVLLSPSAYYPIIYAVIRRLKQPQTIEYRQEILYIASRPEFRGRGVVSGLISEVERILATKLKECYLQVHAENTRAYSLYKKLGFLDVLKYKTGKNEKIIMRKELFTLAISLTIQYL